MNKVHIIKQPWGGHAEDKIQKVLDAYNDDSYILVSAALDSNNRLILFFELKTNNNGNK